MSLRALTTTVTLGILPVDGCRWDSIEWICILPDDRSRRLISSFSLDGGSSDMPGLAGQWVVMTEIVSRAPADVANDALMSLLSAIALI